MQGIGRGRTSEKKEKCPRCESLNTKFCYYNNYSLSQPRYFCKSCRRYWTHGGTLRNVPIGGASRNKSKRPPKTIPSSSSSSAAASSGQNPSLEPIHSAAAAVYSTFGFSDSNWAHNNPTWTALNHNNNNNNNEAIFNSSSSAAQIEINGNSNFLPNHHHHPHPP